MPLGAISILTICALTTIDTATPTRGVPELCALGVCVGFHLWRRNLVLSLVASTTVCLAVYRLLPLS